MSMIVSRPGDIPPGWYLGECAVSGGTMEAYLREAMDFSGGKLCIRLRFFTAVFSLPCPSGVGKTPATEEARQLIAAHRVHYSRVLLTNYLTYRKDEGLFCLLFDTEESLRRKYSLLNTMNIPRILVEDPKILPLIQR